MNKKNFVILGVGLLLLTVAATLSTNTVSPLVRLVGSINTNQIQLQGDMDGGGKSVTNLAGIGVTNATSGVGFTIKVGDDIGGGPGFVLMVNDGAALQINPDGSFQFNGGTCGIDPSGIFSGKVQNALSILDASDNSIFGTSASGFSIPDLTGVLWDGSTLQFGLADNGHITSDGVATLAAIRLPTNSAPTGVTIGITAPDFWAQVYDSTGGAMGWTPVWTNHP